MQWYNWTQTWRDKEVDTFPKGISLENNLKARLEFELAYYDVFTTTPRWFPSFYYQPTDIYIIYIEHQLNILTVKKMYLFQIVFRAKIWKFLFLLFFWGGRGSIFILDFFLLIFKNFSATRKLFFIKSSSFGCYFIFDRFLIIFFY